MGLLHSLPFCVLWRGYVHRKSAMKTYIVIPLVSTPTGSEESDSHKLGCPVGGPDSETKFLEVDGMSPEDREALFQILATYVD